MAFSHGTNAVLKVTSGSLRDFSPYVDMTSFEQEFDKHDVSNLGDTAKDYLPGLGDGTIPVEGPWDETLDGYMATIERTVVACEYYPNGTGTGKVKRTFNAFFDKYSTKSGTEDAIRWTANFQICGAITRTVL